MSSVSRTKRQASRQRGISLVELMVAMVIGLILIAGVVKIFASNKQGYRTHEAMSRIQENGRYAMEILARNVRMAGFMGCGNLDTIEPNVIANNPPSGGLSASNAVRGYEYDGSNWSPSFNGTAPTGVVANTDVITVDRGGDCGAYLVGNMLVDNANIQLNPDNTCNFQAGDVVIISDCASTDIFRATNVSLGASKITIAHANSQNTTNRLSKAYNTDARVYKYNAYDYYIKENAANEPALYVRENGTESELVEGVENLQLEYGSDTDGDRSADSYAAADSVADWSKITSVRADITLRSLNDNVAVSSKTYSYDGANITNKRLRKDMASTIGLRNRIP